MSFLGFVKAFFKSGEASARPRHSGDDLADDIRETIRPSVGAEGGGGSAAYKFLEESKQKGD